MSALRASCFSWLVDPDLTVGATAFRRFAPDEPLWRMIEADTAQAGAASPLSLVTRRENKDNSPHNPVGGLPL
ncbi:MAG: hypothetical protein QOH71_967 [Blastocatellia bacterium]|nr:hypothetical protein [Blastocatellia bacterium]